MRRATRGVAVATALGAVLVGTVVTPGVATAAGHRVIDVKVTKSANTFPDGNTVAPGFAEFAVSTPRGEHILQLLQLHAGYTLKELGADMQKAFSGRLKAIHRVDTNVDWLGGAEATADKAGRFAVTLHTGVYVVIDQEGAGVERLHVTGEPVDGGSVTPGAVITAGLNKDGMSKWRVSDTDLAHRGWIKFRNRANQPHFIDLQKVAPGTTRKDVNDYFQSGSQDDPPWIRAAGTGTGVISPDERQLFHLQLPKGRYLLICFWPDKDTGAPHGVMGMFRLINLV
jgi:hypothetical protein